MVGLRLRHHVEQRLDPAPALSIRASPGLDRARPGNEPEMTIPVPHPTSSGQQALRRAQHQVAAVVDSARGVDVPTLTGLTHRLEHLPVGVEQALEHALEKTAAAATLAVQRTRRTRASWMRIAATSLMVGAGIAAVVVATKRLRTSTSAARTPDPFGVAVAEVDQARGAASASVGV